MSRIVKEPRSKLRSILRLLVKKGIAFFIIAHGLAHLLATGVAWKLIESPDLPYDSTILWGAVDLGETGMVFFGLLWLAAGLGTAFAGVGLIARASWAKSMLLAITIFSLIICLLVFEAARIGILINITILAVLLPDFRLSGIRSRVTTRHGV